MSRIFVLLAALLSLTVPLGAQTLPDTVSSLPWVLDGGRVLTTADANGVLFVGGDFTSAAHPSDVIGPFGAFDATVGGLVTADPRLTGAVNAIVDDGAGGWFLGGRMTAGGELRSLVRIDASGRQVTFDVDTEDGFVQVMALARVGNTLYLGGTFATVNGQPRRMLAAVDIPSQTVLPWRADVTGSVVRALTPLASELFVGGTFSDVGGVTRTHFAALDLATGRVSTWAPPIVGSEVTSIAASIDWVVLGGNFTEVAGLPARHVAVLDGIRLPHRLVTTPVGPVQSVALDGHTLYVAGLFDDVAGTTRYNAAAIDIVNDRLLPWAPLSSHSAVLAMTVAADGVYLAGEYLETSTPGFAVKVDRTTGAVDASWQPRIGGRVSALARGYGQIAIGGTFQTHRATRATGLVAIDRATGALLPTPALDVSDVEALAVRGTDLYVGGYFSRVDGQPRSGLAAIDTTTRALRPFAPLLAPLFGPPSVSALTVSGTTLYVGGLFSSIGGSPRERLGAIDLNTGLATAFVPPVFDGLTGRPTQLLVSGNRLWMMGTFVSVDGAPRGSLAVVDATTGALLPIAPFTQPFALGQLVGIGGDVLVGGSFSVADGAPRVGLARFNGTTGVLQPWTAASWSGNGGVAANGSQIFASGLPSLGFSGSLALFDPVTGAAQGWSPIGPWIPSALFDGTGGLLATGGPSPDTAWPLFYARRSVTTGAPRALSDFGWHVQGTRLTLRWRPAMDGALPTAYRIEAGTQPGAADLAAFMLPAIATGMIADAPAGRFYVRVVPTANGVDGPPSPSAAFITGAISCIVPPAAPVLTSTGVATPILQWTAPPSTGVASYTVRVGVATGAYGLAAIPLPADVTTLSTGGAPPGAYYVSVRATAGCGVTTDSNEVLVTVPAPVPPAAPSALAASVSGSTVSLSWTPPAGAITGYVLEAGTAPGLANLIPGLALGATPSLTAPNVPAGTYRVRVRAANGALVSVPSNEIVVTVP